MVDIFVSWLKMDYLMT